MSIFNKIYWNETLPTSGSQVNMYVKAASSDSALSAATWCGPFTNPSGSNISFVSVTGFQRHRLAEPATDVFGLTNLPV